MNMQTNIPSAGALLAARAMLAGLTISQWSARKTDKRATREVHTHHNAKDDSGTYRKALVAKSALEGIAAIASEARGTHYALTLPWLDSGARLLPAAAVLALNLSLAAKDFNVLDFGAAGDGGVAIPEHDRLRG